MDIAQLKLTWFMHAAVRRPPFEPPMIASFEDDVYPLLIRYSPQRCVCVCMYVITCDYNDTYATLFTKASIRDVDQNKY